MEDYCVACGNPVPEGQMICYECLNKYELEQPQRREPVDEGDLICQQENETGCSGRPSETSEMP